MCYEIGPLKSWLPTAAITACALTMSGAEDLPLPVREGPLIPSASTGGPLLKPTVSIKPPVTATASSASANQQAMQAAEQKVIASAALRRLVLMEGPVKSKPAAPPFLAANQDGKPVTLAGVNVTGETIKSLESFFGAAVTPDSEKKLLDAVRSGLAGGRKAGRKVEVVGWWPVEGVMAVAVWPES